jgi:hypothetical protein
MKRGKSIKQPCDRTETLRALTLGNKLDGKPPGKPFTNGLKDSGLRYNKERAGQTGPL